MDCCSYIFRMKATEVSQAMDCTVRWSSGYTTNASVYILPGRSQSPVSYGMTFEPYTGDFIYGSNSLWRDYIIPPAMVRHLFRNVLPCKTEFLTEILDRNFKAENVVQLKIVFTAPTNLEVHVQRMTIFTD